MPRKKLMDVEISLLVDKRLLEEFDSLCLEERKSRSEAIREAMKLYVYLKKKKGKPIELELITKS